MRKPMEPVIQRGYKYWIVAFLLLLLCTSCGRQAAHRASNAELDRMQVELSEQSVAGGNRMHDYRLKLTDDKGRPTNLDEVKLSLSMTMRDGMHHQTSGRMERQEDGLYHVLLKWEMDGNWIPVVTLNHEGYQRVIAASQLIVRK